MFLVGIGKVGQIDIVHTDKRQWNVHACQRLDCDRYKDIPILANGAFCADPGTAERMGRPAADHRARAFHFTVEHIGKDITTVQPLHVEKDRKTKLFKPLLD